MSRVSGTNGWEDWEGVFGPKKGLGSVLNMSQEEWLETNRQAIADDIEERKNAWRSSTLASEEEDRD